MFQYAAARRLAGKHRTELKLDLSFFDQKHNKNTTPRPYALNIFNTIQTSATQQEIKKLWPQSANTLAGKVIDKLTAHGLIKTRRYLEKTFHFNPEILDLPDQTYLDGYFQSEKYFNDIEKILRKEFTLKDPLPQKAAEIAKQIRATESVSLHVRRGDYITNKAASNFHGICDLDYYRKAINFIQHKIPTPLFYIFSDDPAWVKENLPLPTSATFMADHVDKDYIELILMGYCKHNILANSSFSWWGAWLNENPNKLVVAPINWFKDPGINTNDLIPNNWTRF